MARLLSSVFVILAFCGAVFAQEPTLSIRQFGGVHDNVSLFNMKPGEAVISINWDYSQLLGGIHKRDGITVKKDMTSQPIGLYGYLDSRGDKRLLCVANSTNEALLWYSPIRCLGASYSSVSNRYLYKNGAPFWTQYNDIVILSDGKTPILRYNGNNADYLVYPRPGSPQFIVRSSHTPVYFLHGNYYYSWQTTIPCDNETYGPLTGTSYQVHVDSGTVIIRDFNDLIATGACSFPRPYPTGALPFLKICRTRANKQPTDSMFQIFIQASGLTFETFELYDNIPDTSLMDSSGSLHPFVGFVDTVTRTADTTVDSSYRIGMLTWMNMSTDSVMGGITRGLSGADSIWRAIRYYAMWYDSATMMVTDSGPSLRVPVAFTDPAVSYITKESLSVPRKPYSNTSLWTLIVKQKENRSEREIKDTVASGDYPATWGQYEGHYDYFCYWSNGHTDQDHSMRYWDATNEKYMCRGASTVRTYDTMIVELETPHIVDTIKGTDTIWVDSTSWGTTNLKPVAYPGWTLPPMKYPTVYNDRIYMAEGSKVYYSDVTMDGPEIARWNPASRFDVNPDDGDEVTGLLVSGGELYIFKNHSIYTATYSNGVHDVNQFVRGVGCIAPRSIIDLPGGGFAFLSEHGVYSFSPALQSLYKESGGNLPGMSDAIANHLDKYTVSQLATCVVWLANDDRNLVFSFPAIDSSWVFSIPVSQWGAWVGFCPTSVAIYDTLFQVDQRPMDGILFTQDGSDSTFYFGGSETDTGKAITATWKSGPLFQTPELGELLRYGLWMVGDSTKTVTTTIYDHLADSNTYTDSMKVVYRKRLCYPTEGQWYQFQIQSSADSLAVRGLDLWWRMKAQGVDY